MMRRTLRLCRKGSMERMCLGRSHRFAPTTDGAMPKQKYVCTPTAEMKSDEYGARRIASLAAIDEEEEGISGVWSVGKW